MTKMRKAFFLWVMVVLPVAMGMTGCGLKHVDELLVLKQYADEAEAMDALVDDQEAQFRTLQSDVDQGRLVAGTDQQAIRERYGEPVHTRDTERPQDARVIWMYRRPVHFFESDQILLYFNGEGQLVSHQIQRSQAESEQ